MTHIGNHNHNIERCLNDWTCWILGLGRDDTMDICIYVYFCTSISVLLASTIEAWRARSKRHFVIHDFTIRFRYSRLYQSQ